MQKIWWQSHEHLTSLSWYHEKTIPTKNKKRSIFFVFSYTLKKQMFHNQLLTMADYQQAILDNTGVLLVKFTATWCKPCKKLSPILDPILRDYSNAGVTVHVIDVDECEKLYAALRTKKRINGIPALMCFFAPNQTIYPDDSVTGTDVAQLNRLLYGVQDWLEKTRFVAASSSASAAPVVENNHEDQMF